VWPGVVSVQAKAKNQKLAMCIAIGKTHKTVFVLARAADPSTAKPNPNQKKFVVLCPVAY
jgi:hypothetical protein